jgi:hypothetical protein
MDYVRQLEAQNEQLLQRLAEAEKTNIDRQSDVSRRLPKWFCKGDGYTSFYYGWDCRNIAHVQLTGDKKTPWHIWIAGDNPAVVDAMRKAKTLELAKEIVEYIFSNAAVQK